MKTEQEDYNGNDKQSKDKCAHDDDPDAHALTSSNESHSQVGKIIVIVNAIHCDGEINIFSGDVRWSFFDVGS